ncbi:hypothetical protein ACWEGQ_13805 [Streptomyces seoulensis]
MSISPGRRLRETRPAAGLPACRAPAGPHPADGQYDGTEPDRTPASGQYDGTEPDRTPADGQRDVNEPDRTQTTAAPSRIPRTRRAPRTPPARPTARAALTRPRTPEPLSPGTPEPRKP